MKKRRSLNIGKWIGNISIGISLIGFGVFIYPLITAYVPTEQVRAEYKDNTLVIPKINASSPLIYNVDPFTKSVYQDALKNGVAHAKGTSLPGEDGTVFLFAHSSGNPWELTRYNTVFLRLSELERGDSILLYANNTTYEYTVAEKKEVWPQEVSYLKEVSDENILILQTCTPIGTDLKRLLVFAELTNTEQ